MFSFVERLLSRPVEYEKVKFTAIVSTGRTGTNYLGQLFQKPSLGFISTHEPAPNFERLMVDFFLDRISFDDTVELVKNQRRRILRKVGQRQYVESNGNLTFLLPVLQVIFPQLKVVHIVRNPIDFVVSGVNRPEIRNGVKVQKYLFEENWLLKASNVAGDPYMDKWMQMDIYERFMWTWAFKNEYLARYVEDHGGLTLKFEDLFADKERKGLAALCEYVGFPFNTLTEDEFAARNVSTFDLADKYNAWPEKRKAALREICGPVAARWNYDAGF